MKRLVVLLFLLVSSFCWSQQLDSLEIYTPLPDAKKVKVLQDWKDLSKNLDSLNNVYKTNLFIVRFYLDDRSIQTKAYYKKKSIKKIEKIII